MGREPVQVKACLPKALASWITSRSVLDPPAKRLPWPGQPCPPQERPSLRCAAQHHAVNKTLAPCRVCQEPLGPCAGGVFGPTGMHRSTHGSRTSYHRAKWPGALRAGRIMWCSSCDSCESGPVQARAWEKPDEGRARSEEPIRYCTTDMFEAKEKAEEKGRRGPWSYR